MKTHPARKPVPRVLIMVPCPDNATAADNIAHVTMQEFEVPYGLVLARQGTCVPDQLAYEIYTAARRSCPDRFIGLDFGEDIPLEATITGCREGTDAVLWANPLDWSREYFCGDPAANAEKKRSSLRPGTNIIAGFDYLGHYPNSEDDIITVNPPRRHSGGSDGMHYMFASTPVAERINETVFKRWWHSHCASWCDVLLTGGDKPGEPMKEAHFDEVRTVSQSFKQPLAIACDAQAADFYRYRGCEHIFLTSGLSVDGPERIHSGLLKTTMDRIASHPFEVVPIPAE